MRAILHVTGIVQGVGFRPFVYRLAQQYPLTGSILNMGNFGVKIEVEGKKYQIEKFLNDLHKYHPP